ncbi:MAG: class I SAM-dependent methyltransferase [Candidatus Omnitrophica bacterium]|nr:class I SAM-dependent methyltransferase [Candidatus Omnitrophota bacterium]
MKKKKKDFRLVWKAMFPTDAKRVLDIGCFTGKETQHLIKDQKAQVVGIEINPKAANEAKKVLTHVICADASEICDLPYADGYFDCLIYGGVIGAFKDPIATISKHARYLSHDGYLLFHAPNIRFYKVIRMLLCQGVWDYMPHGILYDVYVRNYTLKNYIELLEELGFELLDVKKNIRGNSFLKGLNAIVFHALDGFLTYEYYFKAKRTQTVKKPKRKKNIF